MFCSEVLSDDLHVSHVSLCVYVIRCLCFHSCCYLNTCVRVDEAWGCPAHKNKSNVEMKWFFIFFDIQQEIFFCGWLKTHLIRADTHLQRLEDGSAVGGQLGVGGLAEELGEGSDGVQFVCWNLERKKKQKTWHQTNIYDHNRPSLGLFSLPSSPQRTFRLQTTAATSCRGWPAACRWRATSPRCRATRRSPWFSPTPARRCRNPCCPGSQEAERERMRLIRLYQQNNTSHFLSSTEKT